jgi:hypothetical protein
MTMFGGLYVPDELLARDYALRLLSAYLQRDDRGHRFCWYVSRDGHVASAGTFLVPDSGSRTFSMTSAADPRDFSTMEITIQSPNKNGARAGTVILSGRTL